MREEHGQIPGGLIKDDLRLYGQITSDAEVAAGVHLDLYGQVAGSLIVSTGGSAVVYGMVTGDLVNRGKVSIAGTVCGVLRDEVGTAQLEPGAVVGGA